MSPTAEAEVSPTAEAEVSPTADTFKQPVLILRTPNLVDLSQPADLAEGTVDKPFDQWPTAPFPKLSRPDHYAECDTVDDISDTLEQPALRAPPVVLEPVVLEAELPCLADDVQLYLDFGGHTDLDIEAQMRAMEPQIEWKKD